MSNVIFRGVCTALITPFDNGAVDFKKLEQLLQRQMDHGIPAVCICGTTGEASTMTEQEHLSVIAHAVKFCGGRMKIIAGTGSNNTSRAVSMSKMADTMGADAVLCVTPYYNKTSPAGLVTHYTQIADAVSCPVILYNVPGRTGVDIPLEVYKELSAHERIAGVKEASGSITKCVRIMDLCGDDFCVCTGNDDEIVPAMSLGAKGVISVLSNLCPTETLAMTNACFAGDYRTAGQLQRRYMRLIDKLFCEVNPAPVKEAMNLCGFDVGSPRLPLCSLTEENRQFLAETLRSYGLIS